MAFRSLSWAWSAEQTARGWHEESSMKWKALLAMALLTCSLGGSEAFAQSAQVRRVDGLVYSYKDEQGTRHYTARRPASGEELRTIKYSYYEGVDAEPPYIFQCTIPSGEIVYTASPYLGCVIVGSTKTKGATFGGFPCTEDCSGHRAGYKWATESHVSDERRCSGNSVSFIQGCIVRARGLKP